MRLEELIDRDITKFTVIATVHEVLKKYIDARKRNEKFQGISPKEIKRGFDVIARQYNKGEFYHTYLQRHTKEGDYFQEISPKMFGLRSELVDDLGIDELESLQRKIQAHWDEMSKNEDEFLSLIKSQMNISLTKIDERHKFILNQLHSKSGNAGQHLEIMAFSILSTYFSSLGFSLKRFSTTFANDGGMDFISSDAFYQVTSSPTKKKIDTDLSKLPGIKRVLVSTEWQYDYDKIISNENVLEALTWDDLENHFLGWLYKRDKVLGKANHLQRIIEIAYQEYKREYNA